MGTARALVFTAPPFLEPAGAAESIEVILPFRVDVDLTVPLHARLPIVDRIRARVDTQIRAQGSQLTIALDTNQVDSLQIEYDASSSLVPISSQDATAIESTLSLGFLGELSLVPDTASTFVHVRCLRAGTPLAGAEVQLVDQDAPPPAGDDANRLGLSSTSGRFTPRPDEVVATATNDSTGAALFHIASAERASRAGTLRLGVVSLPVREAAPDLFLRITAPDGTSLDSRTVSGGFRLTRGPGISVPAQSRWSWICPRSYEARRQDRAISDERSCLWMADVLMGGTVWDPLPFHYRSEPRSEPWPIRALRRPDACPSPTLARRGTPAPSGRTPLLLVTLVVSSRGSSQTPRARA